MVSFNSFSVAIMALAVSASSYALAATHPTNTLIPDNIVICQVDSGCTTQVMFGRDYKVLRTDRLVVMVSLSNEGHYTRADISVLNNGSYPTKVVPEDFRIEVVTPKPKVLSYVAPENLQNLPIPRQESDAPQEGADKVAAQKNLEVTPIPPNEVVRGRVYFERVKTRKAQQVNVVLPIGGMVYQFPYVVKP